MAILIRMRVRWQRMKNPKDCCSWTLFVSNVWWAYITNIVILTQIMNLSSANQTATISNFDPSVVCPVYPCRIFNYYFYSLKYIRQNHSLVTLFIQTSLRAYALIYRVIIAYKAKKCLTAVESHQWIILRTPWDVSVHNKKKRGCFFFFCSRGLRTFWVLYIFIYGWMCIDVCVYIIWIFHGHIQYFVFVWHWKMAYSVV